MSTGEKYVAAAYAVFLLALLVYLAIHSLRLSRLERELVNLAAEVRERNAEREERAEVGVG